MGNRAFKDEIYGQFARVGSALSNPHRLELLDLLAQGERPVEDLAREANMSIANTSQHLQTLREAQLVTADKRGLRVFYRLAGPEVFDLWRMMRSVGELRLAEVDRLVDRYLGDRQEMDAIDQAELMRRIREGEVTVLDARPMVEYRQGHITGAINVPVEDLLGRLDEVGGNGPVVAYCRGPYCVYADETVRILRERGLPAIRLMDGYPEWAAAGLPTEIGERTA